jgi:hypothetical protein
MFSDGLIERRHEDLDDGQARIHEAIHLLDLADLTQGLRDLVDAVRDETRDDDIAAIAVRRTA